MMRKEKDFRLEAQLVGLSEADGRFHAYLQGRHGVWVPPSVRVEWGQTKRLEGQPVIVFPVPEGLAEPDGTRIRSRTNLAWELPRLEEAGWSLKQTDTTQDALLNDFLALADALPLTAALSAGDYGPDWPTGSSRESRRRRKTLAARVSSLDVKVGLALAAALGISRDAKDPGLREAAQGVEKETDEVYELLRQEREKVADFARKWGPLWLDPTHRGDYWSLLPISATDTDRGLERARDSKGRFKKATHSRRGWPGCEPVVAFYLAAKQVKSALSDATSLAKGDSAGKAGDDDRRLGLSGPDLLKYQSRGLAGLVTSRLTDPEGVRLRLTWDAPDRPKLEFSTGFGFLGLAWVQVAQVITAQKALYTCAGCGRPFVRSKKIAPGRLTFCPDCSENSKGSKKMWARRN